MTLTTVSTTVLYCDGGTATFCALDISKAFDEIVTTLSGVGYASVNEHNPLQTVL